MIIKIVSDIKNCRQIQRPCSLVFVKDNRFYSNKLQHNSILLNLGYTSQFFMYLVYKQRSLGLLLVDMSHQTFPPRQRARIRKHFLLTWRENSKKKKRCDVFCNYIHTKPEQHIMILLRLQKTPKYHEMKFINMIYYIKLYSA